MFEFFFFSKSIEQSFESKILLNLFESLLEAMSIDDRLNQESSIIDEKNIATSLIDFDLSLIEQNLSKNSTNSNRKKANSENRIRINVGEDDELELIGYCFSIWRIILIISLTLLSGGIFSILLLIKPALRVRLLWKQCPLEKATVLLVKVCDLIRI